LECLLGGRRTARHRSGRAISRSPGHAAR